MAAKSAAHSSKRSRILYDVNPQAAFLPSVDPRIAAASISRRKRRLPPGTSNNADGSGSSTALAIVSEANAGVGIQPGETSTKNTALIRADDTAATNDAPKPGGILVVRPFLVFLMLRVFRESNIVSPCTFSRRNRNLARKSRSQLQLGMPRGSSRLSCLLIWDGSEVLRLIQRMICLLQDRRIEQLSCGI